MRKSGKQERDATLSQTAMMTGLDASLGLCNLVPFSVAQDTIWLSCISTIHSIIHSNKEQDDYRSLKRRYAFNILSTCIYNSLF